MGLCPFGTSRDLLKWLVQRRGPLPPTPCVRFADIFSSENFVVITSHIMDPLQSHAQQQQQEQAPVQRAEPAWLALNLLKSGDHDACIELCDRLLARSPSNKVTTRCASRHDMPMCDHNRRSGTSRPARSPSATGCRTMTMRKRCETITVQHARHIEITGRGRHPPR